MKISNGVLTRQLSARETAILKESRAALRGRMIGSRGLVAVTLSEIGKLQPSMAEYRFAIRRRLGGIGDVIMSTVALRGLKEKFPKCHLTYVTNRSFMDGVLFKVLEDNPYIDKLISVSDYVERNFDFMADITEVDIRMEGRGNSPHRIDIYCGYLGVDPSSKIPFYHIKPEEKEWAQDYLSSVFKTKKKRIFVNPASNADRRNVPMNTMIEAMKELIKLDYQVVVAHHYDRGGIKDPNYTFFQGDIRKSVALIDACDAAIMHDTGLLHLSGAIQKRLVALFGSIAPDARLKYYKNVELIYNNTVCSSMPCYYRHCDKDYICMKSITAKQIIDGVKKCVLL